MMENNMNESLKKVSEGTCSKCKKERKSLYEVVVFWTFPIAISRKTNGMEKTITTTYNKFDIHSKNYYICEECVKKSIAFKYFLTVLAEFFCVTPLVLYIIDKATGSGSSGITFGSSIFFLIVGVVLALCVFTKNEKAKEIRIKKILDSHIIEKSFNDMQKGELNAPSIGGIGKSNAVMWTLYSKEKPSFLND